MLRICLERFRYQRIRSSSHRRECEQPLYTGRHLMALYHPNDPALISFLHIELRGGHRHKTELSMKTLEANELQKYRHTLKKRLFTRTLANLSEIESYTAWAACLFKKPRARTLAFSGNATIYDALCNGAVICILCREVTSSLHWSQNFASPFDDSIYSEDQNMTNPIENLIHTTEFRLS